jgi:hypothetical protein
MLIARMLSSVFEKKLKVIDFHVLQVSSTAEIMVQEEGDFITASFCVCKFVYFSAY